MANSYLELICLELDKDNITSLDKNQDINVEVCVIKNLSLEILEICLKS